MIENRKYLYPIIWFIFIIFASLSPADKIPNMNLFENADKLVHFVFYFVFTILLIPSFLKNQQYKKSYWISGIVSILIGIMFELLQNYMIADRFASIFDITANTSGSIAGIFFYQFLIKRKQIEKIFFKTE
jgi:VanZ family protein